MLVCRGYLLPTNQHRLQDKQDVQGLNTHVTYKHSTFPEDAPLQLTRLMLPCAHMPGLRMYAPGLLTTTPDEIIT